jgi:tetratricopeptide (TPR) repeat protein
MATLAAAEPAKSTEHAREAEALAEALGDERRLGQALIRHAMLAWNEGDSDRALKRTQRALAICRDDASLQASVNHSLGLVWLTRGEYRRGAEYLRRAAEAVRDDRPYTMTTVVAASADALARLAWCLAELGEFGEAMARSEEIVRIGRETDQPASLIFGYRSLGFVSLCRGDVQQAIPPLERAVELCRVIPVRVVFDITAAHLGYAYALSRRLSEGVALLEEALADPAATGTTHHPLLLAYLGEAHLLAGRRDEATAVAARALDLAHRQKERGNEAWVFRLIGEIAAHADPPDLESAEEHYRQALARADELEMRPLAAHCHLGLGKLYRRTGNQAKAQEHLTTASTMYLEMNMTFSLEKAEAALQLP